MAGKRGDCGCRNHLGKRKVKFPSEQAALEAILRRHLRYGPHRVYACPNLDGWWHVTSVRVK